MKISIDKRVNKDSALPTIRISDAMKAQLAQIAAQNDVTLSRLVRTVIERALADGIEIE